MTIKLHSEQGRALPVLFSGRDKSEAGYNNGGVTYTTTILCQGGMAPLQSFPCQASSQCHYSAILGERPWGKSQCGYSPSFVLMVDGTKKNMPDYPTLFNGYKGQLSIE